MSNSDKCKSCIHYDFNCDYNMDYCDYNMCKLVNLFGCDDFKPIKPKIDKKYFVEKITISEVVLMESDEKKIRLSIFTRCPEKIFFYVFFGDKITLDQIIDALIDVKNKFITTTNK